jgi:alanine racemase
MKKYSRVCARIDLDTVKHNIENIHASLMPETQMMLVLKADGYGHGALPIARLAEVESFVWGFALATVEEAVFLRRNGIQKPLLTLGCLFSENYEDVIKHDIQVMIYQLEEARALSKCAVAMKKKVSIHIKLDTGMGRIGFETTKENIVRIQEIHALPNLNLLGLATHFAKADEEDKTFTNKQIERFIWIRDALQENNIAFPYTHLANSAAVLDMKHSHMDLVRVGIAIHGLYPSESVNHEEVILEPTLSLNSRVSYVKWVEADTPIGYGGTYITKKKSRIVTVPVGYADGYPRSLSNKGKVLIRGKKLPIIGRICMDYLMVDATHLAEVELGDIVTLIGEQQGERITVAELGALSERFPYEFVCDLSKRIPREYLQNNQVVEQIDYL